MIALQKALARLRSFRVYRALARALARFDDIDGEQRAAAFGFYAFLSLFPLVVLLVTVWSFVFDRAEAITMILDYVRQQLPLTESHHEQLIQVLTGVINGRGQASVLALLVLLWGSMRFFHVLVRGVNCAWGTREYSWWRLPLQNLLMLGIVASALVLGIFGPVALEVIRSMFPGDSWLESLAFDAGLFLLPFVVLFYGFSLFYKLAPRRYTRFREVWAAALIVTVLLRLAQYAFLTYVTSFGNFNALYGTLGGIMALLLWIYVSGYIVILGACVSATASGDLIVGRS